MLRQLFTLIFTLLGSILTAYAFAQIGNFQESLSFKGRYLVSISDADMVASAYVNGQLGAREGADALSLIQLSGDPREWSAVEVEASNSVAGPPAAVDITPDGQYAFVIETFARRSDDEGAATFGDLAPGNKLQVFDLSEPNSPKIIQEVEVPLRPDAVRVSADGDLVAVAFNNQGGGTETPLALYRFRDGRLSEAAFPNIPEWNLSHRLIDIDWHPTEDVLALLNQTSADIRFVNVTSNLSVEPFGNIVEIEKSPFRVEFTPDGRHVVANALYWGEDVAGYWVEAPRGAALTVRMNADTSGDVPRHAMVSRVMTGVSPEGLAVSPDGNWIVTTNLERSYLPYDDERITWFSSITLARLDPETGVLTHVGDFNQDSILPEAAVFDNSSRYLAALTYDHFDESREGGSVDFWRLTQDPLEPNNVQLVKTEHSVSVTRGAHSIVIAR